MGEGTLSSENMHLTHRGTFGPFRCEAEGEERVATIHRHWSVQVLRC